MYHHQGYIRLKHNCTTNYLQYLFESQEFRKQAGAKPSLEQAWLRILNPAWRTKGCF